MKHTRKEEGNRSKIYIIVEFIYVVILCTVFICFHLSNHRQDLCKDDEVLSCSRAILSLISQMVISDSKNCIMITAGNMIQIKCDISNSASSTSIEIGSKNDITFVQ